MGKLIYSMITSLDGYVGGPDGSFGWGAPDAESHEFANELTRSIGTYLLGRRMYETMRFWETAHVAPDSPPVIVEFSRVWRAAAKVIYSTTLDEVAGERMRIERAFEVDAVRTLKSGSDLDVAIGGPHLAAQAVRAGLVDEFQIFVAPVLVGGGNPFFPRDVHVDLELLDERRFASGWVFVRYGVAAGVLPREDEATNYGTGGSGRQSVE